MKIANLFVIVILSIVALLPFNIAFTQKMTPAEVSTDCNIQSKRMLIPPIQQAKICGGQASGVICKNNFQLIIKIEDYSAACVRPDTAKTLVERSWGMYVSSNGTNLLLANNSHVTNSNFSVNYDIRGGQVLGMKLDNQSRTVIVSVQTTENGQLIIDLPRMLIDAKFNNIQDDKFFVLNDGQKAIFQESKTSTDRTLTIPFKQGTNEIQIIGTHPL